MPDLQPVRRDLTVVRVCAEFIGFALHNGCVMSGDADTESVRITYPAAAELERARTQNPATAPYSDVEHSHRKR